MDDAATLKRYVETGEQEAFARLVRGHVDLVYAAAKRQMRDPGAAEDVTQAVFILLAKKAKAVAPGFLAGWLLRATHLACRDWRKVQARRKRHEQEAAAMREEAEIREVEWESYAGLVDGAMARLREGERAAVALRYLRGMEWREVGEAMGVSEGAARKRGDRGLARLRELLGKKAAVPGVVALGVMLAAKGVAAAPAGVAESAVAAGVGTGGTAVSAAIAKGVMKMMAWAKVKVAAGIVGGLVLAGGGILAVGQAPAGASGKQAGVPATMSSVVVTPAVPAGLPIVEPTNEMTFRGTVLDVNGRPVEGARVWLPKQGTVPELQEVRQTLTDSQGRYELGGIPMPPAGVGWGAVIIDKAGYALAGLDVSRREIFTDDLPNVIRLEMPRTISGEVVDEAGRPVADAVVTADLQAAEGTWSAGYGYLFLGQNTPYWAKTDRSGRFVVDRVPGSCRAHLGVIAKGYARFDSRDGYRSDTHPYRAGTQGAKITLHPGGECTAKLADRAGNAIAGVLLMMSQEGERPIYAMTDSEGHVVFAGLTPGVYGIHARDNRCVPVQGVTITPGASVAINLELPGTTGKARQVRGRLLDEKTGRPLQEGIYVTRPGAIAWGEQDCKSNREGEFRLDLLPGEYELLTVEWIAGQYRDARMKVTVPADGEVAPLEWKIQGRRKVRGILVDEKGAPLAGAVSLLHPEYVGPDGRFELCEPPATGGAWLGYAVDASRTRGVVFQYESEKPLQEYRLVLRPLISLKGSVVDAGGKPLELTPSEMEVILGDSGRWASFFHLERNKGDFVIARIPTDLPLSLQLSHAGASRTFDLHDVKPGETRDLGRIVLAQHQVKGVKPIQWTGEISGRVIGPDGKGVAGVMVCAPMMGTWDDDHRSDTDQDGHFTLSHLPSNMQISLSCSTEEFGRSELRNVPPGKRDVVWRLKPMAADLIGKPAPQLRVSQWLKGELPDLQSLRGQVVILHVGAAPGSSGLQQAMEGFARVARTYSDRGVTAGMVVTPLPERSEPERGRLDAVDAQGYVEDAGWEFPVGVDEALPKDQKNAGDYAFEGSTQAAYDARRSGVVYVIDKKGTLRGVAMVNELEKWVKKLLAEP